MPHILTAEQDTIVAQATPPGKGGVGIVRISGPLAADIAKKVCKQPLKPRYAHYLPFSDNNGDTLDQGIALFFKKPYSFTGEDVLELQGHGGPVVISMLINTICRLGARLAKPGEFSERAFLNNRIDLSQAEAIADLISSTSEKAARNAIRSLEGKFSQYVHKIVNALIQLRIFVEAAIDFPEEEIDFLNDGKVSRQLNEIISDLEQILQTACQGVILQEGMTVVIAGHPNAGKSSLLNQLTKRETAIVTNIEGTTRDILREQINIDGIPVHIVDTAGLRNTTNPIEKIGIERAFKEIEQADRILLLVDSAVNRESSPEKIWQTLTDRPIDLNRVTVIHNKIDQTGEKAGLSASNNTTVLRISASRGDGIDILQKHLKDCIGYRQTEEGGFSARQRHIEALRGSLDHVRKGLHELQNLAAGELLAESLKLAQYKLNTITGEFSSDDLLGKIFSSFCIGK